MQRLVALAQIRLELHRGGLCFRPATKPDAIILAIVESLKTPATLDNLAAVFFEQRPSVCKRLLGLCR